MRRLLAVALLLAGIGPAAAATDMNSASYWLPFCRVSVNRPATTATAVEQSPCGEMVVGLGFFSCVPSDVTAAQAIRVVIAYIEGHRVRMREPFRRLAMEALSAEWPCK
jgi:hypothetical protein